MWSDPVGVTATRPDAPFLHQELERSHKDAEFHEYTYLMFPSKSIHTDGIRAGVTSSFGFGQVGHTALVVHPRYLSPTLEPSVYKAYKGPNRLYYLQSYKAMSQTVTRNSLVEIEDGPPYIWTPMAGSY